MREFHWTRRGRIFNPAGRFDWMQSHAQNPAVLILDDRLRVFFNSRSAPNAEGGVRAHATYVDLDRDDPSTILAVRGTPILDLGVPGTFDQFGVMSGTVVNHEDEVRVYYVGWTRSLGVPYHHAIGLAISRDRGQTFTRYGDGPVVTRTHNEPFIQNSPFVLKLGNLYHMWYSTGLCWMEHEGAMESIYVIVHATSHDGLTWLRDGRPSLAPVLEDEVQTNPCVVQVGGRYHMWFCYRCGTDFRNAARGYRIGYAWSDDLVTWHRDDPAGQLLPSEGREWDSQMVCYPCVIELNGRLIMFYSGNHFGETGFGYATMPLVGGS